MAQLAPLDLSALDAVTAPFGYSRTLPRDAYTSAALFDWEQTHLLVGAWVCVGRAGELASPGLQRGVLVGDQPVLVVCDRDERLRGFANTCRHRGSELLACGSTAVAGVIRCPYHAWTYGLDGRLRAAPGFRGRGDFDPSELGLATVPVATWGGWLFVNADGKAAPLAAHLGRLVDLLAGYSPERLVVAAEHDYLVAANWKVVAENYHECYHCSSIHPELCVVSSPDSGGSDEADGTWTGGWMALRDGADTMSLSGRSAGVPLPDLEDEARRVVRYVDLVPGLLISAHPDYVLTHRLEPVAVDATRVVCQWLYPPEAITQPGFDPADTVEFWDTTNRQDWLACERVQRGLRSRGYRPGPLSSEETSVYRLLCLLADAYRCGRLRPRRAAAPA